MYRYSIMKMNEKHYKADLKKLSKSKFIKLLKQSVESTPKPSIKQMVRDSDITADDKLFSTTKRPIPKPRGSVKQMVQEYKDNIISPPLEFRDGYKPVPTPKKKREIVDRPVPTPRTKIEQTSKAV